MICIGCGIPLEEDISCRILGGKIENIYYTKTLSNCNNDCISIIPGSIFAQFLISIITNLSFFPFNFMIVEKCFFHIASPDGLKSRSSTNENCKLYRSISVYVRGM